MMEGPAGVGKTRLLASVRESARGEGMRVLSARAGERERDFAWGVVRSLFEPVVAAATEDELAALGCGPGSPCHSLLENGDISGEGTPDSSFALFTGLFTMLRRLAGTTPLLVEIDDLHWVDGPSLGFLEFSVRRTAELPIAVATSLRPNEPGSDANLVASILGEQHTLRLAPRSLTADGTAAMLGARLGDGVDPAVVAQAHELTTGNPLLLNELARTLALEAGADAGELLPGTVAELGSKAIARSVEVRLSRAGSEGRRLAQAAAVLGEDSLLSHGIELAGIDAAQAGPAAQALVRLEVIAPGSRIAFVHPMIRAAIYDSIPAPDRSRMHREASELLEAASAPVEQLAGHLIHVDPCGNQETVVKLRQAAVKAAAGGASGTATNLMRRALAEPPDPSIRTDVLVQLGASELLIDGTAATEHLSEAIEAIGPPPYLQAVSELLARALMFQEKIPEAIAASDRALGALKGEEFELLRRRAEAILIEVAMIAPSRIPAETVRRCYAMLERAATLEGDDYGTRAQQSLAALAGSRDLTMDAEESADRARRAAAGGILIREGMNGVAQLAPAQVMTLTGRYREAIELLNESLRWDERYGSVFGHLSNLIFRGRANLFAGELRQAELDSAEALRMSRAYGLVPGIAWSSATLIETLINQGRAGEGRRVAGETIPWGEAAPASWHWMNFMRARALLALEEGRPADALAEVTRAGEVYAENRGVAPTWLAWRTVAASASTALGRTEEALALATEDLALARRWGSARPVGRALRQLAMLDAERRGELLVEAAELLGPSEAEHELALALVDLGSHLRREGERERSRDPLRRGMDLARSLGAEPLAERARSELRAGGVRARRTALSGPESLTESERRVVELAAAGRSNKEIAAELFVTVKTVEVHLSSAYRKLEVRGRRDLAGILGPA